MASCVSVYLCQKWPREFSFRSRKPLEARIREDYIPLFTGGPEGHVAWIPGVATVPYFLPGEAADPKTAGAYERAESTSIPLALRLW